MSSLTALITAALYFLSIQTPSNAFLSPPPLQTSIHHHPSHHYSPPLHSLVSDSSDYKADSSEYDEDPSETGDDSTYTRSDDDDMSSVPTVEEFPVPMSRNNVGSRWIAVMHKDRIRLTEEHVMWARKQNLYNETFNTESMADVLWSHQVLSSDLQRAIGHVMCIDSPTLADCQEALSRDPIIQQLVGVDPKTGICDVSSIPLYRWRHIRDHTLRRDDGRNGYPNILLAFDHPEATAEGVREANYNKHLEYMIRSERIIAAGPLHVATKDKMDPKSVAVGTLMLFNAKDRDHAIEFVENDPLALEGLYDTMTVSRYNMLDVTGKFVIRNEYFPDDETSQMKEAMEVWGYPVDDDQTKWLNW
ncbi:hypothetical protein ACHAXN_009104 [Cyclotella atomus]